MSIDNMLNKTALIERETVTYSDSADPSSEWTSVAAGVLCAIEPGSGSVQFTQGGPTFRSSHRGYFKSGVDIGTGDRITVEGVLYRVVFVADAAGRGHHIEALLARA